MTSYRKGHHFFSAILFKRVIKPVGLNFILAHNSAIYQPNELKIFMMTSYRKGHHFFSAILFKRVIKPVGLNFILAHNSAIYQPNELKLCMMTFQIESELIFCLLPQFSQQFKSRLPLHENSLFLN